MSKIKGFIIFPAGPGQTVRPSDRQTAENPQILIRFFWRNFVTPPKKTYVPNTLDLPLIMIFQGLGANIDLTRLSMVLERLS